MDHEKFCEAMTELLPNISSEALDAWEAFMTNAELIEETGKSQRTITRLLSALKSKDLIVRIGSKKTGYWQVK